MSAPTSRAEGVEPGARDGPGGFTEITADTPMLAKQQTCTRLSDEVAVPNIV